MEKQSVTIYTVAREARVSMATVSRVVNGNPNVKPETRKKVLDVIKQLRGCDVHTTTILGSVDEGIFRNLGVLVTSDPVFARKKALYQKR